MFSDETARPRQWIANLALAGWLSADAGRLLMFARGLPADFGDIITAAALLIAATFVLCRPRPCRSDATPGTLTVALAATIMPASIAGVAPPLVPSGFSLVVQGSAVLLMGAGIAWLGCNFSILPQYRTIVANGPYAVIRHPIYSSYILFDGALALEGRSWFAGALWLTEGVLLTARAMTEEQLLAGCDPHYRKYLDRVRWRFVPGLV
jgi:protein-S-isoprenylcysteine O-methyltransferase Ste14